MSKKQFTYDSRGQMVKKPGWFSWRHETRDAHDDASARYQAQHSREAKRDAVGADDLFDARAPVHQDEACCRVVGGAG